MILFDATEFAPPPPTWRLSPAAMAGAVLAYFHRLWRGRAVYRCEGSMIPAHPDRHWSAGAWHWTLAREVS